MSSDMSPDMSRIFNSIRGQQAQPQTKGAVKQAQPATHAQPQRQPPPVKPNKPKTTRSAKPTQEKQVKVKADLKTPPLIQDGDGVVVDYVANERKYGYGLGVKGLGRMVHFEGLTPDGAVQYRLRATASSKNATSDRLPKRLSNGDDDPDYLQDVCRTTKVTVFKPLLDEVCEQLTEKLDLSSTLKPTDVVTFLLFRELSGRYDKAVLEPLFEGRYADFKYLMLYENSQKPEVSNAVTHDLESMEQTLHQMSEQIQSSARALKQLQASVNTTQKSVKDNSVLVHGVTQAVAYQLASSVGVISNNVTGDEAVMQSYLQADDAIRVSHIVRRVGADSLERESTVNVDKARRQMGSQNKPE